MTEQTQDVQLCFIDPGVNDRELFAQGELEALAADIKGAGQLWQPITVRPREGGRYQIVMGERRFRAFCHLHKTEGERWATIPAFVRDLTDEQTDAAMLSENIQRKDLDVIEEGKAYKKRIDKWGWTIKRCAQECHVSEGRVSDRIKLLNLLPEVQTLVRHKHMPIGHALAMTDLNKNNQLIALRALDGKNLTQTQFIAVCAELYAKQCQLSMFSDDELWAATTTLVANLTEPSTATTVFPIPNNSATIHLVVEHPSGQAVKLDEAAIAQLTQLILFEETR